ncbi:hypothetical protein DY000_02040514 [Brassica cretica]|uniref:Yippee domain-containing protein n=1 Tax=Brassica cretica TaxID=69181 RepID=A0ABQ7BM50_BRACR|nr:hypothetical protein DY000_02040514 [Brassica cretica]
MSAVVISGITHLHCHHLLCRHLRLSPSALIAAPLIISSYQTICRQCKTDIVLHVDVVSKEFAFEKNQEYKEGKSVLERFETYRTIWITQEEEAGESDTYD